MKTRQILGVKVDDLTLTESRTISADFLNREGQYKIYTPNPEMLVKARKDEYFRRVLNSGDLNLCDGAGLSLFSGAERIPGIEFMLNLCSLAAEQGRGVYLLGSGSDDIAGKAAEELRKKYPSINICGFDKGPDIDERKMNDKLVVDQINNQTAIDRINLARPDILFVAFGMGKQEKWIHENLAKMPSVKIAMGVGGSFDYVSGSVRRAPCWMRKIGLEWLYRLSRQPNRLGRIFNATAVFTLLALKEKFYGKN